MRARTRLREGISRRVVVAYVAVAYVCLPLVAFGLAAGPWASSVAPVADALLWALVVHHSVALVSLAVTSERG